jgi:hypothetical protein
MGCPDSNDKPHPSSADIGAEVQRPLATVVFFGLVFGTVRAMLALPEL